MNLTEATISTISYTKDSGESSERTVIPMYVPQPAPVVRAIDVSELSVENQGQIEKLVQEYREYKDHITKTMFTFENWVAHTYNIDLDLKWRSFKLANITVV